MKIIVSSAAGAVALVVGAYLAALLMGSSTVHALALATVTALAAFVIGFGASCAVGSLVPIFSVVVALTSITIVHFAPSSTVGIAAASCIGAIIIAYTAGCSMAELEHVRYRWVLASYAVEALTVWSALRAGSILWSAVVTTEGIALLLVFWGLCRKPPALHLAGVAPDPPAAAG